MMSGRADYNDHDYYAVLGVNRADTAATIKAAYRKLSKEWHPDKHQQDADGGAAAEERFKDIEEAYDVLSDKNERKVYDSARSSANRSDDSLAGEFFGGLFDPEDIFPTPKNPRPTARRFIEEHFSVDGVQTLHWWHGDWWQWRTSNWEKVAKDEVPALRNVIAKRLERAVYVEEVEVKPWHPTKPKINSVFDSIQDMTILDVESPTWLSGDSAGNEIGGVELPASEILALSNTLLHVQSGKQISHTPTLFNTSAVPYEYEPTATCPMWDTFMAQIFPGDLESLRLLQEWFGYCVSGRIDLHKILLWIGKGRSGKGTSMRVLEGLIGMDNYAGFRLGPLAINFGLEDLIGKTVAVLGDAEEVPAGAVGVLKTISGGDRTSAGIKYHTAYNGTFGVRFALCANTAPLFHDPSGVIADRCLKLTTRVSFLGREDPELSTKLLTELPGILNWALVGLKGLNENGGHFTAPAASEELTEELRQVVSPVRMFVESECFVDLDDPDCWVYKEGEEGLFPEWEAWRSRTKNKALTLQEFGSQLFAAELGIRSHHKTRTVPNSGGQRRTRQVYLGLRLKTDEDRNEEAKADDRQRRNDARRAKK